MGEHLAWDIHDAALLLETYFLIEKNPASKMAHLSKLSNVLRKRAIQMGFQINENYRNFAALNYQYNKLRYLMTGGRFGYPGPIPLILTKVVSMYNSSPDQYKSILEDMHEESDRTSEANEKHVEGIQKEFKNVKDKILCIPEAYRNLPIQCLKLSKKTSNYFYKNNVYTIHELVSKLPNLLESGISQDCSREVFKCLYSFLDKYSAKKEPSNTIKDSDTGNSPNPSMEKFTSVNAHDKECESASDTSALDTGETNEKEEAEKDIGIYDHRIASCSSIEEKKNSYSKIKDSNTSKNITSSEHTENVLSNDRKPFYLEDSITLLPLPNHLINSLLRMGIHTIGQFLHLSEKQISGIHGVGVITLAKTIRVQKNLVDVQGRNPLSNTSIGSIQNKNLDEKIHLTTNKLLTFDNKLDILAEVQLVSRCHLEDSIEVLPLSVRLANILHRNDIHTINQFLSVPLHQYQGMRNMGGKSLAEVAYYQRLLSNKKDFLTKKGDKQSSIVQKLIDELRGNPISVTTAVIGLPISDLVKHVFELNSVQNVGDLIRQPLSFWTEAKECNEQTIFDIITIRKACIWILKQNSLLKDVLIKFMGSLLGNKLLNSIPPYLGQEEQITYIWENKLFLSYVRRYVLQFIQDNEGVCGEDVGKSIPEILYRKKYFEGILTNLLSEHAISSRNGLLYVYYPSIIDYIESITDIKIQKILQSKLRGDTLEKIGNDLGVTRERVRQILNKALSKRPKLEDDRYLSLWEKYPSITDNDFEAIFGWTPERLRYFHMVSKAHSQTYDKLGKKRSRSEELQEMESQFSDNIEVRNKIHALMKRSGAYFLIHGKKVQRDRPGLIHYVVQEYCQKSTTFRDFQNVYNGVLKEIGFDNDENYTLNGRVTINHLANADFVLWSWGKRFRYYDINDIDVEAFLDAINLFEYVDLEISALRIYRSCPDVMQEYDIRDEYELHNLLKKIWDANQLNQSLDSHHKLIFGRMPILTFGQGDRDKQVIGLLQDNSPIDRADLASRYEEIYGVRAGSVAANYFVCIEQYRAGSTYSMQWKKLPEEEVGVMKSQLTGDFYFVSEIRDKLLENFPDEKVWSINGHTLRQLGFLPYQDYVVSNRYKGTIDYFRKLLQQDVADLRDKHYLYNYGTFYAELTREKKAFKIVEVEPMVYYSSQHIGSLGIHVEDFSKFWQGVSGFVKDGAFFTVHSLRHSGFTLPWENLKLSEWFYSSILFEDKVDFVVSRYGKHRLFRKSSEPFSLADFISYVADKMGGHVEFHELIRKIQADYGFCPQKEKMKLVIRENVDLSDKVEVY